VDIRPNVSATSTILTKYIQELDLTLEQEVATALLYGIRAETLDFKRDTTPADLTAAAYLYPFADHDTLEQVESPSMSPETLDVPAEAIRNREVKGSHLVSNAGSFATVTHWPRRPSTSSTWRGSRRRPCSRSPTTLSTSPRVRKTSG